MIRLINAAPASGMQTDVALEVVDSFDSDHRRENGSTGAVRLVLILDAPNAAVQWSIRTAGGSKIFSDPSLAHTVVVSWFFIIFSFNCFK